MLPEMAGTVVGFCNVTMTVTLNAMLFEMQISVAVLWSIWEMLGNGVLVEFQIPATVPLADWTHLGEWATRFF